MITPRVVEWLAGFLEGEGCFRLAHHHVPVVSAGQVQGEPIDRLMRYVGGARHMHTPTKPDSRGYLSRPQHRWYISGPGAVGLMMTVYDLMSPWRKEQIAKALTGWRAAMVHTRYRTHCPQGHPFSGDNLRSYTGRSRGGGLRKRRGCRACERISGARSYRKRKAEGGR